jgi:hypothetical protein
MSTLLIIPAISEYYPDITGNNNKNILRFRYILVLGWSGLA